MPLGWAAKASAAAAVGSSMASHRKGRWRRLLAGRRCGGRARLPALQRRGDDVAVTVATAAVFTAAAMAPARRRMQTRVSRAIFHRPPPRRRQARQQRRQRRRPPPPPAVRGCCGYERDQEERRDIRAIPATSAPSNICETWRNMAQTCPIIQEMGPERSRANIADPI